MTDTNIQLIAGLDRSLAWDQGGSVRYLVADLSAQSAASNRESPSLNLALAIDISGSMGGSKIESARAAALAVVAAMTERDWLSVVAFSDTAELLLDTKPMDTAGREQASAAIHRLQSRGQTNLFDGWLQAAERVAHGMATAPGASPRVLLISDGQANVGIVDRVQIATHVGALLERGVLTSTVGIGDGYDEGLLGAIAEAGGGSLHDATGGTEVAEVVIGELHEGRSALLERVILRVALPEAVRTEIVGAWSHAALDDVVEVMVGSLLPGQTKRVVMRIHCPGGSSGTAFSFRVSAKGTVPNGGLMIDSVSIDIALQLARGLENNAQQRDLNRSCAVANAWQAAVVRNAAIMNRDRDTRTARHYIERELGHLERYARGIPGTEQMLRELVLVQRSIHEEWDERTRKEVYLMSMKKARSETDRRAAPRASLADRFNPRPR